MSLVKPDMTNIWAEGGAVVKPSDVKIQTGWTPEVPPHQWENWIQKRQDEYLAHINERGIPAWDGLSNYLAGGFSYVQGSDGVIYKSATASGPTTTVQDPTTDVTKTYWDVAFAATSQATETTKGLVELATQAEAEGGVDDERVMTPLKVKQAIEQFAGGDFLNKAIATIAAASIIDLTTGAPDTSQLAISGTGVDINGFTVAANRFFVVTMTGATNTLVNSASLVTGRGANIPVAAGDSFLMRSTAANTVEILCGNFVADAAVGTRGQTRQNVKALRAGSTAYTNTTGRPIEWNLSIVDSGTTAQWQLTVGGITYLMGNPASGTNTFSTVVLAGEVYGNVVLNGNFIESWTETRI